ncbi:unnamed protein product, partial [Prorocentrum cordatum]
RWPAGLPDVELRLVFSFEGAGEAASVPCRRRSASEATCAAPPAHPGEAVAALALDATIDGDTNRTQALDVQFTYVPVPEVVEVVPPMASTKGGTWVEVRGGPFDGRVQYWCAWLPALPTALADLPALAARPARQVGGDVVLCETPAVLAPARAVLTLASDPELAFFALGHSSFDLFEELRLDAVEPPRCLVDQNSTLQLRGSFRNDEALECVFLDTAAQRDVGDGSAPLHAGAARTRLALLGGDQAQCDCPAAGNVVGGQAVLRLAAGGVVNGGALLVRFERTPVSLHAWGIPAPLRPLSPREPEFQMLHASAGAGGGAVLPLFGGEGEGVGLPAGAACAVGSQAGEVLPAAPRSAVEALPGRLLGGARAVGGCQLPTFPARAAGEQELLLSPDGVHWRSAGVVDVGASPRLRALQAAAGQSGGGAALRVVGEGFVDGCQCAFVGGGGWDPIEALRRPEGLALSAAATVSSEAELLCSIPGSIGAVGSRIAVAVVCLPSRASSNVMWWSIRPAPTLLSAESLSVHRGMRSQHILLRGSGFAAAAPISCASSHAPGIRFPAAVLSDSLASCELLDGPSRALSKWWVEPVPLLLSVANRFGDSSARVALRIDEPAGVGHIGPNATYVTGGSKALIEGQSLPPGSLWCRFGDIHVPAVVDPYSRQTRAECKVPPAVEQTTTMQVVSTADRTASDLHELTYRPVAQVHRVLPRPYAPFAYTGGSRQLRVDLEGSGFEDFADCKVRFGEVEAPDTKVVSPTLVETVLPNMTGNATVPVHIFCAGVQATPKHTLRFRFEHLPEVDGVDPSEVEARAGQWVTVFGRHLDDRPGRACRFGAMVVGGTGVRPLGPHAVRCQVPLFDQDVQQVQVSFASDGIHYSSGHASLAMASRPRVLAVAPAAAFVETLTPVTVLGHNLASGLQCLFDERVRVEPAELSADRLICDMPASFQQVGGYVSFRVVLPWDHSRSQPSVVQDRAFRIALRRRPEFQTAFPLSGTVAGGTPLTLRGRHLDFDASAACVFGDSDRSTPAVVGSTEIRCLSIGPLDGQPLVANISVRYFAAAPFNEVVTGLQFRFESVPAIEHVHPPAVWLGKRLDVHGADFEVSLPMLCRFSAAGVALEAAAVVESTGWLACAVPATMPTGRATVSVTVNAVEWSEEHPFHIYGGEVALVVPEPQHVSGYGNETVRMRLPAAPPLAPGFGGGPCEDDESRRCLAPAGQAPASCAEYAAAGACGQLRYDVCCRRTCGLCVDQLLAASPPNLACVVDGYDLQPYAALRAEGGDLVWQCALPPLEEGHHALELALLSQEFAAPYSSPDLPADPRPLVPLARALEQGPQPAPHTRLYEYIPLYLTGSTRAQEITREHYMGHDYHWELSFGWTNKSFGGSIFLHQRFRLAHLRLIYPPPAALSGRCGATVLRREGALKTRDLQQAVTFLPKMVRLHAQLLRDLADSEWISIDTTPTATTIVAARKAGKMYAEAAQSPEAKLRTRHDDQYTRTQFANADQITRKSVNPDGPQETCLDALGGRQKMGTGHLESMAQKMPDKNRQTHYGQKGCPDPFPVQDLLGASLDAAGGGCPEGPWAKADASFSPPFCGTAHPLAAATGAVVLGEGAVVCQVKPLPLFVEANGTTRRREMELSQPLLLGLGEGADPTAWFHSGMGLTYEHDLDYPLVSVSPQRGPLEGVDVDLRTLGSLPARTRCLCQFGEAQVPATCVATLMVVRCRAPPVVQAGQVAVRFSMDGGVAWSEPLGFEYYAHPTFGAIQPPLGLLTGVNRVSLHGEKFPTSPVPSFCRWQGVHISGAEVLSSSVLRCDVPGKFKFEPLEQAFADMPLNLEVSFSGDPLIWIPVDHVLTFTHHDAPVRDLQMLVLSPRLGLAAGGTNLRISGYNFVSPPPNESLAFCIFAGRAYSQMAVQSSLEASCKVPALADIGDGMAFPAHVTVDLTFDGGQTSTRLQNVYTFLGSFTFTAISPQQGLSTGSTGVVLFGAGFVGTPMLSCRFGDGAEGAVAAASVIDGGLIQCACPALPPGNRSVFYTVDDQTFLDTGLTFESTETPDLSILEPPRGSRLGGTQVFVTMDGLRFTATLQCRFGYELVFAKQTDAGDIFCYSPPCEDAFYSSEERRGRGAMSEARVKLEVVGPL